MSKSTVCPNTGWTGHSSDMYHCDDCGYEQHWMNLRHGHTAADLAEQRRHTAVLAHWFRQVQVNYEEDARYRRGECPAPAHEEGETA